jgi:hypothetical protein
LPEFTQEQVVGELPECVELFAARDFVDEQPVLGVDVDDACTEPVTLTFPECERCRWDTSIDRWISDVPLEGDTPVVLPFSWEQGERSGTAVLEAEPLDVSSASCDDSRCSVSRDASVPAFSLLVLCLAAAQSRRRRNALREGACLEAPSRPSTSG